MQEAKAFVPRAWSLAEALRIARGILEGHISPLEGSISLASVATDVVADWASDPDFSLFGGIASETDDLPFGDARSLWGPDALARSDADIARYTEQVRGAIVVACRHIIDRFDGVPTRP